MCCESFIRLHNRKKYYIYVRNCSFNIFYYYWFPVYIFSQFIKAYTEKCLSLTLLFSFISIKKTFMTRLMIRFVEAKLRVDPQELSVVQVDLL